MAIIYTNKGHEILVDDSDYDELNKHVWYVSGGYAVRWAKRDKNGKRVLIRMHRVVIGLASVFGFEQLVDHINHDKLDNRRKNLRIVSRQQNQFNFSKFSTNTTGYTGVSPIKSKKKPWQASIGFQGKCLYLGSFATKEEAYQVYLKAKARLHVID